VDLVTRCFSESPQCPIAGAATNPQLQPAVALQFIHDVIQQRASGVNEVNSTHYGHQVVVKGVADMGQGVQWIC